MSGIHAAILAYGDRLDPLKRVLQALEATRIARVVVLANAVSSATASFLEAHRATSAKRVDIRHFTRNLGSAGGYSEALAFAFDDATCQAAWLLDDDNVPEPETFSRLATAFNGLETNNVLLACIRPSLPEYSNPDPRHLQALPRADSCVGFHILNAFGSRRRRLMARLPNGRPWLSVAPYGGLLVPRAVVERHGGPDRAFFLYADDVEWTSRLTLRGCRIELLEDAPVHDADDAWNGSGGSVSNLRRRIEVLGATRVYYEVRNRNWLSLNRFNRSRAVYRANRIIFLAATGILAIRARNPGRFRLIHRAIRDSEADVLGEAIGIDSGR